MSRDGNSQPLIRKLSALSYLEADDLEALAALPATISLPKSGTCLVEANEPSGCFYALVEGYAYRSKSTEDGRSQIVSFHVPGDLFDLALLLNEAGDTNVVTIGATKVAAIPLSALRNLRRERPNIADALWRDTLLDAAIFREWVLNVGQRDSRTRIAHLLAEFVARRAVAIPDDAERFEIPVSQIQIAAATGMTSVHVNRMLKELEADGALSRNGGHVVLSDPTVLKRVAGFNPGYLQPAATGI
jgi:CRP-like cAMP-binding protein